MLMHFFQIQHLWLASTRSILQAKSLVTKETAVLETKTGSISECHGIEVYGQTQEFLVAQGAQAEFPVQIY